MGPGTWTNIFSGRFLVTSEANDGDEEYNNNLNDPKGNRVVLKILDQSHKEMSFVRNCWKPRTTNDDPSIIVLLCNNKVKLLIVWTKYTVTFLRSVCLCVCVQYTHGFVLTFLPTSFSSPGLL